MTFFIFKNTHIEADDPSLNTRGCFNKGNVSNGLIDKRDITETPFMMDNINKNPCLLYTSDAADE